MSLISRLIQLNELQVNGQTVDDNDDFNVGEEEDTEATPTNAEAQSEAPDEVAQDNAETQTQEAEPVGEDNEPAPQADVSADTTEQEDDFTLDDTEDAPTTNSGEAETPAEENTKSEGTPRNAVEGDGSDEGGDDDFTVDGGDEPTEGGESGGSEGGSDQKTDDKKEKDLPKDPSDAISDDDDRAAEEAIYDSLTDDQKRIRVLQLKLNYKDLYETMSNAIEGINGIPKNAENLETIKRLILLLTKARNILIDYIENNFDTCPYLENYTTYIKYIAVFRTASKVIEELNNAKK